jgi:hypothetical protein
MNKEKAYALNEQENFDKDWRDFLNGLACSLNTEEKQKLIGMEYLEGEVVPITTRSLVHNISIISALNERAWEEGGEYADDWPDLSEEEETELEDLIVGYLEKKHAPTFYVVTNIIKKTITADDIKEILDA